MLKQLWMRSNVRSNDAMQLRRKNDYLIWQK